MEQDNTTENNKTHFERFDAYSRFLHILIIVSFLSLAVTGMLIKFSGVGAFQTISKFLGGYQVTGFIHRVGAIITFLYFFLHIIYLLRKKRKKFMTFREMAIGEHTLLPRKEDAIEFFQSIKWFLGLGPRPRYGTWTYWEKFDYFAVFWGVAIIGGSGLLLWFPEFFTLLGFPGQIINIATIIHSDEALLASGFIFTIHFYNSHFRPEKFPMDTVIFTGKVSLEELKEDRPREYELVMNNEEYKDKFVEAPPDWLEKASRIFGFCALITGILIVILIIYSMLFLYQ